jgi:hypothetical protein
VREDDDGVKEMSEPGTAHLLEPAAALVEP